MTIEQTERLVCAVECIADDLETITMLLRQLTECIGEIDLDHVRRAKFLRMADLNPRRE